MLALYVAWRLFRLARGMLALGVIVAALAALAAGQLGRIARAGGAGHAPGLAAALVTVRRDVQEALEHALRSPQRSPVTSTRRR